MIILTRVMTQPVLNFATKLPQSRFDLLSGHPAFRVKFALPLTQIAGWRLTRR
jgi:hypothetical protein